MGVVHQSPMSRKDLASIWNYVADQSGPDVADALLRTINKRVQFLSGQPSAGRARSELRPRLRSFPAGKYMVFYRRARGGIHLARVIHGARDLRRIFPP